MVLTTDFTIKVLRIHNKHVLVGKVLGSNVILRFRFFKSLCLKTVVVDAHITITHCEFSKNTKMVNCHAIAQTHFFKERKKIN
jgi:hypothetical protein